MAVVITRLTLSDNGGGCMEGKGTEKDKQYIIMVSMPNRKNYYHMSIHRIFCFSRCSHHHPRKLFSNAARDVRLLRR